VHIIARPKLRRFAESYPDSANWLDAWWRTASAAQWRSVADVKATYSSVDKVGDQYVFNVRGNKYRLIVWITFANDFARGTVFVRHVLTHAEYDAGDWKKGDK
jgi:mRNA interferase HigB